MRATAARTSFRRTSNIGKQRSVMQQDNLSPQTEQSQTDVAICTEATDVVINLSDVSYYYKTYLDDGTVGEQIGVENVNLTIKRGEFVALVGHNGSGKSTLAKLFNGLIVPKSGVVTVNGLSTAEKQNLFEIRKTVGMVFQNPDNQTVAAIVEDDVAFGPENLGVPQPEIVERVHDSLERVGMLPFAKKSPHNLSGGQKQRVAIAGALAMHPQVLVLDESTAMLDPLGRKEVLSVAKQLNGSGMTVVLITHFMEEVDNADRVIVMSGGHVVGGGAPDDIFADSALLRQVGLKAPRTVELAQKLNQIGFDVDTHCIDAKRLGGELCQKIKK